MSFCCFYERDFEISYSLNKKPFSKIVFTNMVLYNLSIKNISADIDIFEHSYFNIDNISNYLGNLTYSICDDYDRISFQELLHLISQIITYQNVK